MRWVWTSVRSVGALSAMSPRRLRSIFQSIEPKGSEWPWDYRVRGPGRWFFRRSAIFGEYDRKWNQILSLDGATKYRQADQRAVCFGSIQAVAAATTLQPRWVDSGCTRCGLPYRRFGSTSAVGKPHEQTSASLTLRPKADRLLSASTCHSAAWPKCPRRVASGGSGQATRLPPLWVDSGC
jgi:hypothetical protein